MAVSTYLVRLKFIVPDGLANVKLTNSLIALFIRQFELKQLLAQFPKAPIFSSDDCSRRLKAVLLGQNNVHALAIELAMSIN